MELARKGWKQACRDNNELLLGLNVVGGKVVYKGVSDAWNLPFTPVKDVL
jgi:alanine dehydrogenase